MGEIAAPDANASAALVRGVLAGSTGPVADVINLNLAAVLWMAGRAETMREAFNLAREIQQSGAAERHVNALIDAAKGMASTGG
jgi:anthranilate phosphoribosyltransferase